MPRKKLKRDRGYKNISGPIQQAETQSWKIACCFKMIKTFIAKYQTPVINKLWLIKESASMKNNIGSFVLYV